MPRLVWVRLHEVAAAAVVRLPFRHLGHVRLRLINVWDINNPVQFTAEILEGDPDLVAGNYAPIQIFQAEEPAGKTALSWRTVIWEGDLEIQADQLLHVFTQNATVSDQIFCCVGYEYVE